MNNERMLKESRLAAAKSEREIIELGMRGFITQIRNTLDPYKELLDINFDQSEVSFSALARLSKELKEKQKLIDALEEDLFG